MAKQRERILTLLALDPIKKIPNANSLHPKLPTSRIGHKIRRNNRVGHKSNNVRLHAALIAPRNKNRKPNEQPQQNLTNEKDLLLALNLRAKNLRKIPRRRLLQWFGTLL